MKKSEINFENYLTLTEKSFIDAKIEKHDFLTRCIFNNNQLPDGEEYKKKLQSIIRKSENTEDFITNYLNEPSFKQRQAYAELSYRCRPDKHWYRIREMLGEKVFKTMSDCGGVKIGNEHFHTIISNGQGDGTTRVAVLNIGDKWNKSFLSFTTSVEGDDINIYSYDCGDSIAKKLDGNRYGVYSGYGFVVFEKWN